ncbi:hypothetical protein SAMN05421639_103345 [Chryseobacterium shigense]|uniref:Uncharacterized protein n=1 Tax=Chryseobacterium shigense TaxID=297244 RepID=A0A1N7IET6_9FLAO|nr:hypothetical protein [Chryseobacterium shigense]SIS35614.1 hypothetical protein SAMN05421639_103345 [Chryseobacterium shigense]
MKNVLNTATAYHYSIDAELSKVSEKDTSKQTPLMDGTLRF